MSEYRQVHRSFWESPSVEQLDPVEKLVYLYCISGPLSNMEGLYRCSLKRMAFETGLDQDTTGRIMERLESMQLAGHRDGWVCVTQATKHMPGGPKMAEHARRLYESVPAEITAWTGKIGYAYPIALDETILDKTETPADKEEPDKKSARYDNLVAKYGKAAVDDYVERVRDYSAAKGKTYKDYVAAAATWMRRDNVPERPRDTSVQTIADKRREVFGE